MNKKDYLTYSVILVFISLVLYFGINKFSYFDAPNMCYVSISKDILRGNRKTIINALKIIKRDHPQDYQDVCQSIDRISEGFCIASDWHLDPNWMTNAYEKSCYIKGSKTIYLYPRQENTVEITRLRTSEIISLSKLSIDFWQNKYD